MSKLKSLTTEWKMSIRTVIVIAVILALAAVLTCFMPADPQQLGLFSLIPAIFLIAYIFATKRVVEGLVLASLIGVIMVTRPVTVGEGVWAMNAFSLFSTAVLETMMEEDIAWLIICCGLMGSIITLIERTGGAHAFGKWAASKAKTQKSGLIWTWILGLIIFVDDYLNALTVGACMTDLNDKHKVPREFLAYVVDSTAAPVCVLVPITTWSVFVGRILETNGWAPAGQGLVYFIKTIPYNFYGWVATFIVPLAILGIIPALGPMKKAFQRVKDGGPLAPKGSEKIDMHSGDAADLPENPNILNMVLPILVLVISTVLLDNDLQQGVLVTLAFCFVLYLVQGLLTPEEFVDVCIDGFKSMILPLLLMVLAFLFARVNREIHFTEYVITTATSLVTPKLMPLIVFFALSITEFITGTNWGMYIIALPIVIPLAQTLGVNMPLAVSAVLSAGVFGSHICFYSDATVITSAACGCDNMRHAATQLPYGLLAAIITAVMYLVFGMVMG